MRVSTWAGLFLAAGFSSCLSLRAQPVPQTQMTPQATPSTQRTPVQRMQPLTIVESQPGLRVDAETNMPELDAIEDTKAKKRCIPADFIQEAVVKDDKTIDLILSGKKYYAIKFKDRCHGLGFDRSFYYYLTPSRQLCARFDTIVTRSGSRCLIDKISKREAPEAKKKKSKDEKKASKN